MVINVWLNYSILCSFCHCPGRCVGWNIFNVFYILKSEWAARCPGTYYTYLLALSFPFIHFLHFDDVGYLICRIILLPIRQMQEVCRRVQAIPEYSIRLYLKPYRIIRVTEMWNLSHENTSYLSFRHQLQLHLTI